MRDTDLYQHLLGLSAPWTVSRVALDAAAGRVDVWAEHDKKARFRCPECGKECGLYDHDEERVWRHLDSCQFQTFLHARIPRVRCDEHGVKQARVPWAEPKSRFTMMFERLAIDVMLNMDIKNAGNTSPYRSRLAAVPAGRRSFAAPVRARGPWPRACRAG